MKAFLLLLLATAVSYGQVSIGNSHQYKAVCTYSDGSTPPCPSGIVWNSATSTVFSINNSTGNGVGLSNGTSNVTATVGGITSNTVAQQVVTLTALTMTSVVVVSVGQSLQLPINCNYSNSIVLSCYALDAYGDSVSYLMLKAGTTNVATVGPTGIVTGVTAGSAAVWAETNSLYGESFIVVQ